MDKFLQWISFKIQRYLILKKFRKHFRKSKFSSEQFITIYYNNLDKIYRKSLPNLKK